MEGFERDKDGGVELDALFFAVAVPATLFAGISKGGFGSGAAFASSAILAIYLPPGQALAVMLPLLMLIDFVTLGPYWKQWRWPEARMLMLGAIPGVILGAIFYRIASPELLRFLIGAVAVFFVVWQIGRSRGIIRLGTSALPLWSGLPAGLTVGFTSFVSHAGGPPASIYLLARNMAKTEYQATTVLVFWVVNIAKVAPYAALGLFSSGTTIANLALAPFAVLGAWIGVRLHRMVPEKLFFGITYVLLAVTGTKLMWDSLF